MQIMLLMTFNFSNANTGNFLVSFGELKLAEIKENALSSVMRYCMSKEVHRSFSCNQKTN